MQGMTVPSQCWLFGILIFRVLIPEGFQRRQGDDSHVLDILVQNWDYSNKFLVIHKFGVLPGIHGPFRGAGQGIAGFSLHAGVAARADERKKLERLCRYISRPAMSEKRLALTPNDNIHYQLKASYRECGGAMKVIACIEDPVVIKQILDHLKRKADTSEPRALPESRAPPVWLQQGCLTDESTANRSVQMLCSHRCGMDSSCRMTGILPRVESRRQIFCVSGFISAGFGGLHCTVAGRFNSSQLLLDLHEMGVYSSYAMQAEIFAQNIKTAFQVISDIHCGGVMVNDSTDYRIDAMPFGGVKGSGLGR